MSTWTTVFRSGQSAPAFYCVTAFLEVALIPFQGVSPTNLTKARKGRSSSTPERSLVVLNQPGTQLQKLIWVPAHAKALCGLFKYRCYISAASTPLISHIFFHSSLICRHADMGMAQLIDISKWLLFIICITLLDKRQPLDWTHKGIGIRTRSSITPTRHRPPL